MVTTCQEPPWQRDSGGRDGGGKRAMLIATNTMLAGPPGRLFGHKGRVICLPSNPLLIPSDNSDPSASCTPNSRGPANTRLYVPGARHAPHGRRIFSSNYSVRSTLATHVHCHAGIRGGSGISCLCTANPF